MNKEYIYIHYKFKYMEDIAIYYADEDAYSCGKKRRAPC